MRLSLFGFYIISLILTSNVLANSPEKPIPQESSQKQEATTIYYFDTKWNHTNQPVTDGFYRKLIKKTPEGWYVVQDFYQASDQKQTDPIILKDETDLTNGSPNSIEGNLILWHKNGQKELQAHYIEGKEQGLIQKWYNDGTKEAEFNYNNGKQEGLSTLWDKKGNKTVEAFYKDNLLDGPFILWLDGKQVAKHHYVQNKLDGNNTSWDHKGYKHIKHYEMGKLEGLYSIYYPNGNKQGELLYHNDSLTQTKFWYKNTQAISVVTRKQCEIWDESGDSIYQGPPGERCALTIRNIMEDN